MGVVSHSVYKQEESSTPRGTGPDRPPPISPSDLWCVKDARPGLGLRRLGRVQSLHPDVFGWMCECHVLLVEPLEGVPASTTMTACTHTRKYTYVQREIGRRDGKKVVKTLLKATFWKCMTRWCMKKFLFLQWNMDL